VDAPEDDEGEQGGEDWEDLGSPSSLGGSGQFDPKSGKFMSKESGLEDLPRLVRSMDDDWARVECAGIRRSFT